MCTVKQFYIVLISITIIKISYALNDTTNENQTEINGRKIIRKCCPMGQHVNRTRCQDYNKAQDFRNLKVYDKNIYDTNKSFDSVFTIVPKMFEENPDFKLAAINMNALGFIPYIIEDGSLQLELPNTYNRWNLIGRGNFCIDYIIMKSGRLTAAPKFFTTMEGEVLEEPNDYLTIASLVSFFFMVLVLLVYILLPELQNLCGLILMAYLACLCMAFLLLAIIQSFQHTIGACIGLTLGIYYFFLVSFCWMTVMSYDIWWTFRGYAKARPIHRRGELFKFLMYSLYSFGVPLLMTIGLGILNTVNMKSWPWFITPHVPSHGCFLEGSVKLLYLYVPMLILNVCNWMFFLMTAFNLWRLNRATAILDTAAAGTPAAHRTQRHRFMVYLKLATVMGLNWVLEVVSFLYPGFKVWYLTDFYNILIGFFIFLIFVCKKKIYRKLYKRYVAARSTRRYYPGSAKSYSSSSSTSDTNQETTTLQVCSDPKGVNSLTALMKKT